MTACQQLRHAPSARPLALSALLAGPFIGVLDVYIVTVAAPSIKKDLGASFGEIQLVVASYSITYAVGLITGGRLGDLYGRRRLYALGLMSFVVTSTAAAVTTSPGALISARAAQGAAAALMIPQVLAIVRATMPEPHRSRAIGLYGMTIGLGAVFGPALGGLIIGLSSDTSGWRLVFLVNVPIGILAAIATLSLVPESRAESGVGLDVVGTVLFGLAMIGIMYPLTQGVEAGWPLWAVVMTAIGLGTAAVFFAHQHRRALAASPSLLPVQLLSNHRFMAGLGLIAILYGAAVSAPLAFILPYYFQTGLGYTALRAGIVYVPVGLGYAIGSWLAGRMFSRYGSLAPAVGVLTIVVFLSAIAIVGVTVPDPGPPSFMPLLLGAGLAQGLAVNPVTAAVMSSVRPADAGAASGLLLTVTQLAGACGVAAVGAVFFTILAATQPFGPDAYGAAIAGSLGTLAVLTAVGLVLLRHLSSSRLTPSPTETE
jgi:EmrB/QacA subfamily drug resistance transporter